MTTSAGSRRALERPPTIKDVAQFCGLSKATVSKALNLPAHDSPVTPATRRQVLQAAEQLGYRPSWQGRALADRRTRMIAMANADPLGAVPRGQYWDIVDQLDGLLAEAGLVPVYIHTYQNNPRAIEMLSDRRFDGCLSLDPQPPEVLAVLRRANLPTVLVNGDADASWMQVRFNDVGGTEQVMRHLIGLGHRRIAFNAGRRPVTHSNTTLRSATYTRCMREAGLTPDQPYIGPVEEFVDKCLTGEYRPTAILDHEHWTAVRVVQQLWRRGVRVPEQMSVATFNDTYPVDLITPPLTVVGLPEWDISQTAAKMLTDLIENPSLPPRQVTLDLELVPRESTAPPAGTS